jgi:hypothetical protein
MKREEGEWGQNWVRAKMANIYVGQAAFRAKT